MAIPGSIDSFSLGNSQGKDFAQKIPCISHELVNSMLSLSLVLILGEGRRPRDMWYSKGLNDFRWKKKIMFSFLVLWNLCGLFNTLSQCPFWALKVKSTRFPLEESVWGELLSLKFFTRRNSEVGMDSLPLGQGSRLPSSSPGLVWGGYSLYLASLFGHVFLLESQQVQLHYNHCVFLVLYLIHCNLPASG